LLLILNKCIVILRGMGRGLSLEGIDVSFGLSLPWEDTGIRASAAPLGWVEQAATPGWDGAAAPPNWGAPIAPLRRILGDFLPAEGFRSAELPIEALAAGTGSGGLLSSGGLGKAVRAGAPVRDFCLRLGRRFADPDCPAAAYREAVAECRALYEEIAAGSAAAAAPESPAAETSTAVESLRSVGPMISAFLLDFPLGFAYGAKERRHLDRLVRDLEGLPLAIAFFNPAWYSQRVIEALREKNIGLCLMDFPSQGGVGGEVAGGVPPRFDMATSSLIYLKFHGFSPAAAAPGELKARLASWIPRLEVLALQVQTLRIVFQGGGG
jgi:hypothetical protein